MEVERIELNDGHIRARAIAAAILLVLGAFLIAISIKNFVRPDPGWQVIPVNASAGATCGSDFTFFYEAITPEEVTNVTDCYSKACQKAFRLFHSDQGFEGVVNVFDVNRRPNEILEVDAALYGALETAVSGGRRELFLGPVYERYDDLFYCSEDYQAVDFDPRLNGAVAEEYRAVLAYANDPQAVGLEFLDGNRIRLRVSEGYLSWAEAEGISKFIDFSWMRNAFIADYLAEALRAEGFTAGVLTSFDGFSRNLDVRGQDYTYPLTHRWDDTLYPPADLHYSGPMSLVRLRDYPVAGQDLQLYHQMESGEIRTKYLDAGDALCKSAVDTLLCYSRERSCAELLLEMIPIYIADEFREDAIPALAEEGVASIYCQGSVVRYTDPEIILDNFFDQDGVRYSAEQIGK